MTALETGYSASVEHIVTPADTACAIALSSVDAFPEVFATSRMIALMEVAAARAMQPLLRAGELSVGVGLELRHGAATPLGGRVRATATYLGRQGKLYRFCIEASDEAGPIGGGEHTRAVVETERLLAGAAKRRS
jgi:predicted thioesterase